MDCCSLAPPFPTEVVFNPMYSVCIGVLKWVDHCFLLTLKLETMTIFHSYAVNLYIWLFFSCVLCLSDHCFLLNIKARNSGHFYFFHFSFLLLWLYQYCFLCPMSVSLCFVKRGAGKHLVIISATFSSDFTYWILTRRCMVTSSYR